MSNSSGTSSVDKRETETLMLPARLVWRFVVSGWYPGRRRGLHDGIPKDHPAAEILVRFGGLTVGRVGDGKECATSDIQFRAIGSAAPDILAWNALLQTTLVGIGEVDHGHGELYIDSHGRCYGLSSIHDAFYFERDTFGEAVERILLGRRSLPMLRPDRESVDLYGITHTANHPDTHSYG